MITPFSENRHKPTTLVPDISLSLSRVLLTIPQRVRASFKTTSSVSSFMHYSGHERPKDLFDAADSPASEDFLRQVEADAAQLEDGRLGWVVRLDEPIHEQKHRLLRIGEDQILPAAEGRPCQKTWIIKFWPVHWKTFLDASTHLYKRVCPSVHMSVCHNLFINDYLLQHHQHLPLTQHNHAKRIVVPTGTCFFRDVQRTKLTSL